LKGFLSKTNKPKAMLNIIQWQKELQALSDEIQDKFSGLDVDQINMKPAADQWSIAENIAHLIQVNSSYFPIFKKLQNGSFQGAFIGKISFFPKLIGQMIHKSVSDGGKRKIKTFKSWEPSSDQYPEDVFNQFRAVQQQLIEWLNEPFVLKNPTIHSPVNPLIVYSLFQAVQIIIAHEKRHISQAEAVLAQLNSIK
jgi:uncharacterized damage-inducible protein DinB